MGNMHSEYDNWTVAASVQKTLPMVILPILHVAFCLQIVCWQNDDTFSQLLCHLANDNFAYRNNLHSSKLCINLATSVGQNIQKSFSTFCVPNGLKKYM
jgi:hypothetical protein